jgi:PAS domain S-box-containing protein
MSETLIGRLLLIDEDPEFVTLLRAQLDFQGWADTELTHVGSLADAENQLAGHRFDIILLDPGVPDSSGIESVRRTHAAAPHIPLVVLSGRDDESLALRALQEGAQDYLVKGQINAQGLLRFLRYAVERNSLEDALFTERERAQVTLNSIGDAVACTDPLGGITFLNGVAEELTGWTLVEAAGMPFVDIVRIVDAATREAIPDPIAMAIEQEQTLHLPSDSVLIRRDGFETPIEDSVAPIYDRERRASGAVIVFRDVSAWRSSKDQLRAAKDELERSNHELQDFAAVASHDLQEPLRKIQAFGDRLADRSADVLGEEANDSLRRMTSAAARMQSLISDLLDYSQVTVQPELPRPVDLGIIVSEVLSDLDERIRSSHGRIRVGPLPTVLASPLRMRQLFQNLIANALKFHPSGVAPRVRIDAVSRGARRGTNGEPERPATWQIRIQDNGIGFDQEQSELIFAPFQRLDGRQAFEGTGMGLAICRRIVAMFGGTITARSQPGKGSTFVITLPRTPVTPAFEPAA